jgi:hypothetical protein
MHRTRTLDYAIVLSGEIYAVLDEGEVLLEAGDVLVRAGRIMLGATAVIGLAGSLCWWMPEDFRQRDLRHAFTVGTCSGLSIRRSG